MVTKTRKYERLPPESGVPFSGFKFAEIESRKPIAKEIESFVDYCIKDARSPSAKVVLGEWGEGKSEVYNRYIVNVEEQGRGWTYDVSVPTILETYKTPERNKKIKSSSSMAVQFLTTVFWSVQEELKAREVEIDKIPSIEGFSDNVAWLKAILENHQRAGSLKIFIFIDQVEELILETEILKWFLTGIRETIDGKFAPISEGGLYAGSVFFFLSCTPDAYNRMRADPDIDQIFGGQQRRMERITLAPITKIEGAKFFYDLLKFSYAADVPSPPPLNEGTLLTLYRVTKGNLGSMVSIFTRLMSRLATNGEAEVATGEFLTDWLLGEEVSIYGGVVNCMEREILNQVENFLQGSRFKAEGSRLIRMLAGELRPFALEELAALFNMHGSQISQLVNTVNEATKGLVKDAIVKVYPLREGVGFQDVVEKLRTMEYIKTDDSGETVVEIDNYKEKLASFQDRITFFSMGQGVEFPLFLPIETNAIEDFFEGVSEQSALQVRTVFSKLVAEDARYYILSEQMATKLFPIPVPPWLQFIRNRDLRLRLWRDAASAFHEHFEKFITQAFVLLLERVERFKVGETMPLSRNYCVLKLHEKSREVDLLVLVYSKSALVTRENIEEVEKIMEGRTPRPHLAILLYTHELTEDAMAKARESENLILVRLHPTHSKVLTTTYRTIIEYPKLIDQGALESTLTNLAREIGIDTKLQTWLDRGVENGLVVTDITAYTAKGGKELAEALKFYINFLGLDASPEEIFELNQNRLQVFVPYGRQPGFAPDIETATQLRKLTEDMKLNGFVTERLGKIKVMQHPVEGKILDRLRDKRDITIELLEQFFVLSARAKTIMRDVYLSILEYKGIVKEEYGKIMRQSVEDCRKAVSLQFKEYSHDMETLLTLCKDFGHIYIIKQRGSRLISLQKFDEVVKKFFDEVEKGLDEKIRLQRMRLLSLLIDHFYKNLKSKVEGAINKRRVIESQFRDKFNPFCERCKRILSEYNRHMGTSYALSDLTEYVSVEEKQRRFEEINSKEFTEKDLLKAVQEVEQGEFDFRKWDDREKFFNIKLALLAGIYEKVASEIDQRVSQLDRISGISEEIDGKVRGFDASIISLQIPDMYRLSYEVHTTLRNHYIGPREPEAPLVTGSRRLKLSEIEADLREINERYVKKETALLTAIDALGNLFNTEKGFLQSSSETSAEVVKFRENVDVKSYVEIVDQVQQQFQESIKKYAAMRIPSGVPTRNSIDILNRQLREHALSVTAVKNRIQEFWENYKRGIKLQVDVIEEVLNASDKLNYKIKESDRSRLRNECKMLLDWANNVLPWKNAVKLSEFERARNRLTEEMYSILSAVMPKDESLVLHHIIEQQKKLGVKWVPADDLRDEMQKTYGIDAIPIIRKLIDRGIIKVAVNFAT